MRYGRTLFHSRPEPEFGEELEDKRADFNDMAEAELPEVYELLLKSPAIPEALRSLLASYRERLLL